MWLLATRMAPILCKPRTHTLRLQNLQDLLYAPWEACDQTPYRPATSGTALGYSIIRMASKATQRSTASKLCPSALQRMRAPTQFVTASALICHSPHPSIMQKTALCRKQAKAQKRGPTRLGRHPVRTRSPLVMQLWHRCGYHAHLCSPSWAWLPGIFGRCPEREVAYAPGPEPKPVGCTSPRHVHLEIAP